MSYSDYYRNPATRGPPPRDAYHMPPPHNYGPPPQHYAPNPAPVVTQPAPVTTTNIEVNVGGGGGGGKEREWFAGLYGCCDDCCSCWAAWLCPPCFLCYLADKMGECFCMPIFVPYALTAMRVKLRGQHSIKGSICKDYLATQCCYLCVMCQLKREIEIVANTKK